MSTRDDQPLSDLDDLVTQSPDGPVVLAGRYRVVRRLGEGGMGVVYLAEDQHLDGRRVAIKMPSALLSRNARAVAALKREAVLAMTLSHPHIVTLRGFEQTDDGVFLVMDYIEGSTLEDLLAEKGQLDESEVRRIFQPVAEALDYAHGQKLLHRDIKPSNILLDGEGRPYLTDFGVARELKDTYTRVTGKQDTSGTLPYMSPQQVNGEKPEPSQDIYSLAATMYECLTGDPPFCRGDITHQIMHKEPEAPKSDTLLTRQVMRGLSKEGKDRPGTCVELLVEAVSGDARSTPAAEPEASPPTGAHKAAKQARRAEEARRKQNRKNDLLASPADLQKSLPSRVGESITNSIGMKLTYIPAGGFVMGSPAREVERRDDETQHRVRLSKPFLIGTTAVTQGQWLSVMRTNPSRFQGDDLPVEMVSWHDAVDFCWRLSEKEGKMYRLPTESEWEYACRAGATGSYGGTGLLDDMGWYGGNSGAKACPVGGKQPNAWGLYDMHGNVWEWCNDWYGHYPNGEVTDPTEAATGSFRVLRGGSWNEVAQYCRSAYRFRLAPDYRYCNVGFRAVLDFSERKHELLAPPTVTSRPAPPSRQAEVRSSDVPARPASPVPPPRPLAANKFPDETGPKAAFGSRLFLAAVVVAALVVASFAIAIFLSPAQRSARSGMVGSVGTNTVPSPSSTSPAAPPPPARSPSPSSAQNAIREASRPSKAGEIITNSIGMKLAYIPSGEFVMGSPATEVGRDSDESPLHRVHLTKAFLMGTTEVTQGQWRSVMGTNPSYFKGDDNLPVEQVSWHDAAEFCRRLSQKDGREYRLPTEAEWEYGCRAGTTGMYAGSGRLDDMGWYGDNSGRKTQPVGEKQANAWGLYDMHGNVWEWCQDWFGNYPNGEVTNPPGPANGTSRVLRGGSRYDFAHSCRSANREGSAPNHRLYINGFRVVCVSAVLPGLPE